VIQTNNLFLQIASKIISKHFDFYNKGFDQSRKYPLSGETLQGYTQGYKDVSEFLIAIGKCVCLD